MSEEDLMCFFVLSFCLETPFKKKKKKQWVVYSPFISSSGPESCDQQRTVYTTPTHTLTPLCNH